MVMMTRACSATPAGESAARAPAATSASTGAAAAAVHDDVEAVLAQVERHGPSHEAQADEANRSRHMRGYLTWEGFRVQRDAGVCRVLGAGCKVRSASGARGMPLECAMRLTASVVWRRR